MKNLTTCPTCGSDKIKKVRRNLKRSAKGIAYTVPLLEFYECPDCQEKVFDSEAMRKIESYSPSFEHLYSRKKVA